MNPTKIELPTTNYFSYHPENFARETRVRIYLAWYTCQDVFIREGIVLKPNDEKMIFGRRPALRLLVERAGILRRREPRSKTVLNSSGYMVRGEPSMHDVDDPFIRSYLYRNISLAEIYS